MLVLGKVTIQFYLRLMMIDDHRWVSFGFPVIPLDFLQVWGGHVSSGGVAIQNSWIPMSFSRSCVRLEKNLLHQTNISRTTTTS